MKTVLVVFTVLMFVGCNSRLSGDYGGPSCMYSKLSFQNGRDVFVTVLGMDHAAKYKIDGDKVVLTSTDGNNVVFTKTSEGLKASVLGEEFLCKKL